MVSLVESSLIVHVRNAKKMQKISREISVRAKLSWEKERIIEDDGKFREKSRKEIESQKRKWCVCFPWISPPFL
jgi:hypothetical protein